MVECAPECSVERVDWGLPDVGGGEGDGELCGHGGADGGDMGEYADGVGACDGLGGMIDCGGGDFVEDESDLFGEFLAGALEDARGEGVALVRAADDDGSERGEVGAGTPIGEGDELGE